MSYDKLVNRLLRDIIYEDQEILSPYENGGIDPNVAIGVDVKPLKRRKKKNAKSFKINR